MRIFIYEPGEYAFHLNPLWIFFKSSHLNLFWDFIRYLTVIISSDTKKLQVFKM